MHDHCAVVLGGWDSRVARAEVEQAHKLQTPMFVSYAWSPDITKLNYPEVVRIGPNNDMSASAFAPFLKARGFRNVALLADDAALGQGLGPAIRVTAVAAGIDVAAHEFKRDAEDLRPKLKTIMARNPDALVLAAGPFTPARMSRSPRHGQPLQGRHRARLGLRRRGLLEGHGQEQRRRHLAHLLGADAALDGGRHDVQEALHEAPTSTRRSSTRRSHGMSSTPGSGRSTLRAGSRPAMWCPRCPGSTCRARRATSQSNWWCPVHLNHLLPAHLHR